MSWDLSVPAIKDAKIGDAHALLLQSNAPTSIKEYVRIAIAGLAALYGNDVRVSVSGYGHLCDGVGSYDVSTSTIEVTKGDVIEDASGTPAPLKTDGPTVEDWVKAGYKATAYPPGGYTSKSTPEEIAAAVAAENEPEKPAEKVD